VTHPAGETRASALRSSARQARRERVGQPLRTQIQGERLTIAAVARAAKLSRQAVQNVLFGASTVTPDFALRLAAALETQAALASGRAPPRMAAVKRRALEILRLEMAVAIDLASFDPETASVLASDSRPSSAPGPC